MAEAPYFQESYGECRAAFLMSCRRAAQGEPDARLRAVQVPAADGAALFMDSFFLPARKRKKRLVFLSSGIHGVEGFAGSAMQQMFLSELLGTVNRDETAILLFHGLNPHGFHCRRRVTERNVDLNRNFARDRSLFSVRNPGYERASALLNPKGPASASLASFLFFAAGCVKCLPGMGLTAFRQAILGGQYAYPEGLFFGGGDFEPQNAELIEIYEECTAGHESLLLIDLHTGYGTRGVLHLLDLFEEPETRALVDGIFAGFPIVGRVQKDEFYKVSGDFLEYIASLGAKGRSVIPMTFECGTADTLGAKGGLSSLWTMVLENRMARYGAKTEKDEGEIRRRFVELFYPSDPAWRAGILRQARELLSVAIGRFEELF